MTVQNIGRRVPKRIRMRLRHRNYVHKSSKNHPPMKPKRRQTKMVFLEEDWPPSSIEFVEQHDASQCIEIDDALQSESSRVIKNSEFVFEDALYGELPKRGGKIR